MRFFTGSYISAIKGLNFLSRWLKSLKHPKALWYDLTYWDAEVFHETSSWSNRMVSFVGKFRTLLIRIRSGGWQIRHGPRSLALKQIRVET